MNDFLSFRRMITPVFIQAIFWFFAVGMIIVGLFMMIGGIVSGDILRGFFAGMFVMVAGPLFVRIYCELLIILFRIYDELVAIRTGGAMASGQQGFPVMPSAPQYPPPGQVPPPGQYPPPPPR
jgi:hypothetical protein